jgi:hypothetical protein
VWGERKKSAEGAEASDRSRYLDTGQDSIPLPIVPTSSSFFLLYLSLASFISNDLQHIDNMGALDKFKLEEEEGSYQGVNKVSFATLALLSLPR